jgi:hypothetical protein
MRNPPYSIPPHILDEASHGTLPPPPSLAGTVTGRVPSALGARSLELTIPLGEFIAELQRVHATLGNHPTVKLRVSSERRNPEIVITRSEGSPFATIAAHCFQ